MFTQITLRGGAASILWGHRTAVVIRSWSIAKHEGRWTLKAAVQRVDAFQSRQTPLLFAAPRDGGYWAWPIESLNLGSSQLVATLGPPEQ